MRIIFGRLCASGLKVNAPKCSFGLNGIPYLGYVITRVGIKPNPKKVKGIIYLRHPNTTTEAQALTGMVQYYMDMFLRLSHVVATMAEADRGPKSRKYCGMTL